MKLLTKALEKKLRANAALPDNEKADLKPVVKFFTPDAGCTWLISELMEDGTMFGLCDLGMGPGCTELGYVSMDELTALRGKLGLPVERDLWFTPKFTLAEYAEKASMTGRAEG